MDLNNCNYDFFDYTGPDDFWTDYYDQEKKNRTTETLLWVAGGSLILLIGTILILRVTKKKR